MNIFSRVADWKQIEIGQRSENEHSCWHNIQVGFKTGALLHEYARMQHIPTLKVRSQPEVDFVKYIHHMLLSMFNLMFKF